MANAKVIEAKIPPQNVDAEKSLIGAVLIDEDVLADVTETVDARDFYDKRHATIFESMVRLFEHHKPVDLLTLTDELKKKKRLEEVGGTAYLTELTNYVPTAAHAVTYGEMVALAAVRRRLIKASADIAEPMAKPRSSERRLVSCTTFDGAAAGLGSTSSRRWRRLAGAL